MTNNESPRSALADRFFRLEGPHHGGDGGKDVFNKISSFGNDVKSPIRASKTILVAPLLFDSPSRQEEEWGLVAPNGKAHHEQSPCSAASSSSCELFLPPLPLCDDSSCQSPKGHESGEHNVVSFKLHHCASIIQVAVRGFLTTKAVFKLRIRLVQDQIVEMNSRQNAAVKIQTAFRCWYCHTLFQIAALQHRLKETQQNTKDSLAMITQKKQQEMEEHRQAMVVAGETSFRRGERYLVKAQKLGENLRAENEMITDHNEELAQNNEEELKRHRDLYDESMSLQRDIIRVRSKLERLQIDQQALKTSSKVFEKRIHEFEEVMNRVKVYSAAEAKVTAVTTDAIYKTLAVVGETCTNEAIASHIIADGMNSLLKDAEYAKALKETARHTKHSNVKTKQQKVGKRDKAEKGDKKKNNKAKNESSKKSKARKDEKIDRKKLHARFLTSL